MTDRLTPREIDVLRCAANGLLVKETAKALGIASGTVDHHRDSARRKLNARNTAHAAAKAWARGEIA